MDDKPRLTALVRFKTTSEQGGKSGHAPSPFTCRLRKGEREVQVTLHSNKECMELGTWQNAEVVVGKEVRLPEFSVAEAFEILENRKPVGDGVVVWAES